MGPSLTHRDLADLAGLAVRVDLAVRVRVDRDLAVRDRVDRDLAGLDRVDRDLAVQDPVDLAVRDRACMRGRVDLDPVDLAGLVDRDLAGLDRVDLAGLVVRDLVDRAVLAVRDRVCMRGRVDPDRADLVDRVDLAVRDRVCTPGRLDLVDRADPGDQGMNRADLAGRADRDLADRSRSTTRPEVLTIGVALSGAAPIMRHTALAHPTTVRRPRPRNADSAGMAGLLPVRHRLTGTGHRPRVVGTVLRLLVVGTARGMGPRVT